MGSPLLLPTGLYDIREVADIVKNEFPTIIELVEP
jgi:hypothetical protein